MQENADQVKEKNGSQKKPSRIFGERKWESKFYWILSIIWAIGFILKLSIEGFSFSTSEALQIAMLWVIMGYLSELRYRLFKDVRRDRK